ncbi:MAG TPA: ATP-binding cassette domain-containing protein [Anaerolineae bacterium]|nr:ATP-binding cassette domain-containing protein [Anaerolineae bacterium]
MTEQIPQSQPGSTDSNGKPLLEVHNLKMYFPIVKGVFGKVGGYVKAADEVSFSIQSGETLGLVGESGCGKTTVGRCLVRAYKPTDGSIIYQTADKTSVDLAKVNSQELQIYRKDIRMIFQDPYSSLNPRMNVFEIISEVLRVNNLCSPKDMEYQVASVMKQCGLRPEYMRRYPHAFSGGERQRIGIARALVTSPRLVVCDEAVSGLDVSVRAQILNLMEDLRRDMDLTYLFISHDLSVIRHICDRVAVMYVGKLVELADANTLYTNPLHPYTESLMSAVPIPDPNVRDRKNRIRLEGEVADPSNPPSGCYFHPRCRYAKDRCGTETPILRNLGNDHFVACHFAEELALNGVQML